MTLPRLLMPRSTSPRTLASTSPPPRLRLACISAAARLISPLISRRTSQVSVIKTRYEVGLHKLLSTAAQVADMQTELEALKPQLIVKSAEADEMMVVITKDRAEADQTRTVVEREEKLCTEKAEQAIELKASCEKDLAEALPALNAALKALKGLSKNDIIEVTRPTSRSSHLISDA